MRKLSYFKSLLSLSAASVLATTASAEFNTPTLDGTGITTADYTQLSVQTEASGFGDDNQLDGLYMANDNDNLYIGIAGDLDGNAQFIFLNTDDRGTTNVATDPVPPYGEFNDFAQNANGAMPAGFLADFVIQVKANGDTGIWDLGSNTASFVGASAIDNSTAPGTSGAAVDLGIELAVSLADLGIGAGDSLQTFAILGNENKGGNPASYMSNQVLPPQAGASNYGNDGAGGAGGDGLDFDGTDGLTIAPLSFTLAFPPSGNAVREVWAATEDNAADFEAESFLVDTFDSRGIAFMPASAAGNSSGVDKVIPLPNESGGTQTLPFLRAADGELIGSSSITWTTSGFLASYDIDVDADGAIISNSFGGAVSAALDDQGTSMTQIIDGTLDAGGGSRSVDVAGSISGGNATVYVGSGTSIAVYDNFTTPGATVLDFEHVENIATGFGADIQSIAAISDTVFYAVDGGGGSPIKKFEDSGSGFVATDITDLNGFVKTGIDVAGDFIFIAESGGAKDGFLVLRESTGDIYTPDASIDSDADGAYDGGAGIDINNANFVASLAVNPATLQGFGLSTVASPSAVDSAIVSFQAANSYVVPSGPYSEPSAALAALVASDPGVPGLVSLDGNTTDTARIETAGNGSFILQGNGNTIIVAPVDGPSMASAISTSGTYIDLAAIGENPLYCIEDVTLAPADLGADTVVPGGSFGSNAILAGADAGEGFGLQIDNVTIGGNLAGTVIADPNDNQWANVTRFNRGLEMPSTDVTPGVNKVSDISNLGVFYAHFRGIEINTDGADNEIGPGVVVAWSSDEGAAFFSPNNSSISIAGEAGNRNLFRGSGQRAGQEFEESLFFGSNFGSGAQGPFIQLTYTDIIGNGGEIDFNENLPALIDNCFIAENAAGTSDGQLRIGVGAPPTTYTLTVSNVTIFDEPGADTLFDIDSGGVDNLDITLTNVVLAGAGDIGIDSAVGAFNTITLNGVGFANAGVDALATEIQQNDAIIVDLISVSGDPGFINKVYSYPTPADYLQVGGDASFDDAGPGATDISGAGGPVLPGADVTDWSILNLD